jgi:hypothetical protein
VGGGIYAIRFLFVDPAWAFWVFRPSKKNGFPLPGGENWFRSIHIDLAGVDIVLLPEFGCGIAETKPGFS